MATIFYTITNRSFRVLSCTSDVRRFLLDRQLRVNQPHRMFALDRHVAVGEDIHALETPTVPTEPIFKLVRGFGGPLIEGGLDLLSADTILREIKTLAVLLLEESAWDRFPAEPPPQTAIRTFREAAKIEAATPIRTGFDVQQDATIRGYEEPKRFFVLSRSGGSLFWHETDAQGVEDRIEVHKPISETFLVIEVPESAVIIEKNLSEGIDNENRRPTPPEK